MVVNNGDESHGIESKYMEYSSGIYLHPKKNLEMEFQKSDIFAWTNRTGLAWGLPT